MRDTPPPLEYLVTSSQAAIESFELSRLNRIANLRKEIRQIVDDWIAAETEARIARWILDCRRLQSDKSAALQVPETVCTPSSPETVLPALFSAPDTTLAAKVRVTQELASQRPNEARPDPRRKAAPSAVLVETDPVPFLCTPISPVNAKVALRLLEQVARSVQAATARGDNLVPSQRADRATRSGDSLQTGSRGEDLRPRQRDLASGGKLATASRDESTYQFCHEKNSRAAPPMRSMPSGLRGHRAFASAS